jgi:uncharacterized damage-inducible protein DinB
MVKSRKRKSAPKKPARVQKVASRALTPDADASIRHHLATLLSASHAHAWWRDAFAGVPIKDRGVRPAGVPHSLWQLLEHIRLAQWDILEFSRNPKHVSPEFPSGYWPATEAPPSEKAWDDSIRTTQRGLLEMRELVLDPNTNLYSKIPHGTGQTILREALLIADHNAYHTGQAVLVRRLLGAWKE